MHSSDAFLSGASLPEPSLTEQLLAAVPGNPLQGLRQADRLWKAYRENTLPVSQVVQTTTDSLTAIEWDCVICGGTLGILLGTVLAQRGWRIALLERGVLRGREQEWNISRQELQVLVELELLTEAELEQTIATTYNPARIAFHKGVEVWVEDVLNIGVDPVYLLDTLKAKFLQAGGHLLEQTAFESATIHANGVTVTTTGASSTGASSTGASLTTRLLLDAMGHFSPIARQSRQGKLPDAVCLVVGTCATGFPVNETGDLFVSITPSQNQCQYFWEAFPARDGRTTYLFTYLDPHPDRPSLEDLFADYWQLLPDYQNLDLAALQIQRALFGFFPCYRHSPLQMQWDRLLAIGDSSGSQSPLSFGGFGAMMRHLYRLSTGVDAALQLDLLDRQSLKQLQPYQPNLSVTWLFQRAMSMGIDQSIAPDQINTLLSGVFEQMNQLGDSVLKPFLQDVVQFPALLQTLLRVSVAQPLLGLQVIPQVGLVALLDWLVHFTNLGLYTALYPLAKSCKPVPPKFFTPAQQYAFDRWLEALQYGSGQDYHK